MRKIGKHQLYLGDCLKVLKKIADNSIDSIVTDPPYGIKFMGKKWDHDVPSIDIWKECLRVLKPGGYLLSFAGTRTQHRMAVNIEDAGFEIRDMIAWTYGCLDTETKIATNRGVLDYTELQKGDLAICYDIHTQTYSYQPLLEVFEYDYCDTAYRLIGDTITQVVSKNHNCIVEQDGGEVFQRAEALECEARVPILEDLRSLQESLSNAESYTSSEKQNLLSKMWRSLDFKIKGWKVETFRSEKGTCNNLQGVQEANLETRSLASSCEGSDMRQAMQRCSTWSRLVEVCSYWTLALVRRIKTSSGDSDDRRIKPSLERWSNLQIAKRTVRKAIYKVRSVSKEVFENVTNRRLRDGTSSESSANTWSLSEKIGMCSSQEPQCHGQQTSKLDVIQNQQGPQAVRSWSGHKSSLVRVEKHLYEGKVWCVRVPTGAFVAVRNGVAFPTGNSGFPKSQDVGKAIDKAKGAVRKKGPVNPARAGRLKNQSADYKTESGWSAGNRSVTTDPPATKEAKHWDGWGVALKPALEPITVARKPIEGTVVNNVLRYGTGAINIDGCRISTRDKTSRTQQASSTFSTRGDSENKITGGSDLGRFPANLIHDGSDEIIACFPQSNSARASGNPNNPKRGKNHKATSYGQGNDKATHDFRDTGSASRFFYCAKTSRSDRDEGNNHPTVKPTDLMRYLVRLVTRRRGIVLDPFMGSGSTGKACIAEGMVFYGIEKDKDSFATSKARIRKAIKKKRESKEIKLTQVPSKYRNKNSTKK